MSIANVVAGFVGNRLLTEVADPGALGEYYLLLNVSLWLAMPAAGGYMYVFRHWPLARARCTAKRFARAMTVSVLLIALCGFAVALALPKVSLGVTSMQIALLVWAVGVAQAAMQIAEPIQAVERRRILAGILALAYTPLRMFVLAIGTVAGRGSTGSQLLALHAAYAVLVAATSWGLLVRLVQREEERDTRLAPLEGTDELGIGSFIRYSMPFLATAIVTQLCASAERWRLARIDSPRATAMFVLASGLATAGVAALANTLMTYYQPIVTQAAAKSTEPLVAASPYLKKFVAYSVGIAVAVTVAAAMFARPATGLLFGSQYDGVAPLLPWTVCGAAAFAVGQALTLYSYVARESLGPNGVKITTQLAYVALLEGYSPREHAAEAFARMFAATNIAYALGMLVLVWLLLSRAARNATGPGVPLSIPVIAERQVLDIKGGGDASASP